MPRSPYASVYERLMAGITEPDNEQACWRWSRRTDRWGYAQINVYVPGLGRNATLKAHIALYILLETGVKTADDLFLAYLEHSASGLELDHLCREQRCIRPCHLEVVTGAENCRRRSGVFRP